MAREAHITYNREDDRYYIYDGEDYIWHCKDQAEAFKMFDKVIKGEDTGIRHIPV